MIKTKKIINFIVVLVSITTGTVVYITNQSNSLNTQQTAKALENYNSEITD